VWSFHGELARGRPNDMATNHQPRVMPIDLDSVVKAPRFASDDLKRRRARAVSNLRFAAYNLVTVTKG